MVGKIGYQNVHLDEVIIFILNLPLSGPILPSPIYITIPVTSPAYFKSPILKKIKRHLCKYWT